MSTAGREKEQRGHFSLGLHLKGCFISYLRYELLINDSEVFLSNAISFLRNWTKCTVLVVENILKASAV